MNSDYNNDKEFNARVLLELLPRLLKYLPFRRHLKRTLNKDYKRLTTESLDRLEDNYEDYCRMVDAASDALDDNLITILSLGWDGDFPGNSGAMAVRRFDDMFFVYSTDGSPRGPFNSLEATMRCDFFENGAMPNLTVSSDVLSLDEIIKLIGSQVDWENETDVWINDERYRVLNGELFHESEYDDAYSKYQKEMEEELDEYRPRFSTELLQALSPAKTPAAVEKTRKKILSNREWIHMANGYAPDDPAVIPAELPVLLSNFKKTLTEPRSYISYFAQSSSVTHLGHLITLYYLINGRLPEPDVISELYSVRHRTIV